MYSVLIFISVFALAINYNGNFIAKCSSINVPIDGDSKGIIAVDTNLHQFKNDQLRFKRQINELSGDVDVEEIPQAEEEDGFWTRVGKAALNLLKRLLKWLNE